MCHSGLRSKLGQGLKATTGSGHPLPLCANLLKRNFDMRVANTVWVSDKAEPEGYLPFGMEGALEDYVDLVFTDPRGEELGSIVSLERPAELGLSVRLTTDGARSPVLHGVRIRYESA